MSSRLSRSGLKQTSIVRLCSRIPPARLVLSHHLRQHGTRALDYKSLDPSGAQIRVLNFEPSLRGPANGNDLTLLKCTTQTVSLDDKPEFIALSYVWGLALAPEPIFVDACPLRVTQNLHDALVWYRARHPGISIWADAICINQTDLDEKAAQISLMSRVYRQATNVLCWLGPSTPRIETYLDRGWALSHSSDAYLSWSTTWADGTALQSCIDTCKRKLAWLIFFGRCWIRLLPPEKIVLKLLQMANGQSEFIQLEYFQRMWTFQESTLPQKQQIVFVLGNKVRPPHYFTAPPRFLHVPEYVVQKAFDNAGPDTTRWFDTGVTDIVKEVTHPAWLERLSLGEINLQRFWTSTQGHRLQPFNLAILIQATLTRVCHDPRDKIFAVLGLLEGTPDKARARAREKLLVIDYAKSAESVLLDSLYYMYKFESWPLQLILDSWSTGNTDDVPSSTGLYPSAEVMVNEGGTNEDDAAFAEWLITGVPSWIPKPAMLCKARHYPEARYPGWVNEDKFSEVQWHKLETKVGERDILRVTGKTLGRLVQVYPFPDATKDVMGMVQSVLRYARSVNCSTLDVNDGDLSSLQKLVHHIKHRKNLPDRLNWAMTPTQHFPIHLWRDAVERETADDGQHQESLTAQNTLTNVVKTAHETWFAAKTTARLQDQALFILETGHFGLCTAKARIGDLAVLSEAWGSCLILREDTDNMPTIAGRFCRLIDRPYIDGLSAGFGEDAECIESVLRGEDEQFLMW